MWENIWRKFGDYLDIGEYLDYANCKCRKKLINKVVEECNENIPEKELHSN